MNGKVLPNLVITVALAAIAGAISVGITFAVTSFHQHPALSMGGIVASGVVVIGVVASIFD